MCVCVCGYGGEISLPFYSESQYVSAYSYRVYAYVDRNLFLQTHGRPIRVFTCIVI